MAFEFVFEAIAGAAAAGAGGVAALDHEVIDDAVEDGAVVEFVAARNTKLLTVLGRLWEQFADDFAGETLKVAVYFLLVSIAMAGGLGYCLDIRFSVAGN